MHEAVAFLDRVDGRSTELIDYCCTGEHHISEFALIRASGLCMSRATVFVIILAPAWQLETAGIIEFTRRQGTILYNYKYIIQSSI